MKDLLIDLVVEYNYERKLEAIARDEKNEIETRAHSRAAYALSNVIEKALIKEDIEIIRLTETFEYFNKVDFACNIFYFIHLLLGGCICLRNLPTDVSA